MKAKDANAARVQELLREMEGTLAEVMTADARWCADRLAHARRRLDRGQPADRLLGEIRERLAGSRARVEARRARVPLADYDPALPITARREEIIEAIRAHPVLIVAGEDDHAGPDGEDVVLDSVEMASAPPASPTGCC